jgi:hypothetical protein
MSLGPYLLYIVRVTLYVWIRSGGFSSPRRMGEVQRDAPPFPSMVVSKHMPSAKETPICGIYKVDQSVTERYNFIIESGLPSSPLQGGPAFLLPAPRSYAVSYVQTDPLRCVVHKSTIIPLGCILAPQRVGRPDRGDGRIHRTSPLRRSAKFARKDPELAHIGDTLRSALL